MSTHTLEIEAPTRVVITDKTHHVQHYVDLQANKCSCDDSWGCWHKDVARKALEIQKTVRTA